MEKEKKKDKGKNAEHAQEEKEKKREEPEKNNKRKAAPPTRAVINKRIASWRKQSPANIEWYCTELFDYDQFDPEDLETAIRWLAENKPIELEGDTMNPSADGRSVTQT